MKGRTSIKAVFWDNDGVLVDTEKLYFRATRETLAKIGLDLTGEVYVEHFLRRSQGTWHLAKELGFGDEDVARLRTERNELYGRLLETETEVMDGAADVLGTLHGKVKMGIVTSSRRDHFDIIHRSSGLLRFVDFSLTSQDFEKTKPDPEPYLKALEVSGMRREDCIAVEDSERGLRAALAAGLKCYIVPTDLTRSSDFTGAAGVLTGIREIVPIVLET